jgi:N-acetylmuramic acid 6-phosphate (MurNAc-6-P) etherase
METTGASREAAREALARADQRVKVAIVMLKLGVSPAEADSLLETHLGHLRPIIGDPPAVTPT